MSRLAVIVVLLSMSFAGAQEPTGVQPFIRDDRPPSEFTIDWQRDGDGNVIPALDVHTPHVGSVTWWVEGRMGLGADAVEWSEGPLGFDHDWEVVDVALPASTATRLLKAEGFVRVLVRIEAVDRIGRTVAQRQVIGWTRLGSDGVVWLDDAERADPRNVLSHDLHYVIESGSRTVVIDGTESGPVRFDPEVSP